MAGGGRRRADRGSSSQSLATKGLTGDGPGLHEILGPKGFILGRPYSLPGWVGGEGGGKSGRWQGLPNQPHNALLYTEVGVLITK